MAGQPRPPHLHRQQIPARSVAADRAHPLRQPDPPARHVHSPIRTHGIRRRRVRGGQRIRSVLRPRASDVTTDPRRVR
ncbi:hypothetical protein ACFPRL_04920 [Pseudoclavibacter helvolus]